MATTVGPRTRPHEPVERFVLYDIGWDGYETILRLLGDRPVRTTYDRGSLELMSPLREHEEYGRLFGILIQALGEELDLPCIGLKSTTLRRQIKDRGLEPDECFYLANAGWVVGTKGLDLNTVPPPDLAIEIDITSSSLDRMGVYAALGVPEVWRYDGESLQVVRLQPDGTYAPCASSPSLPFLPLDEVVRLLRMAETMDHSRWGRQVRAWIRAELVPRLGGEGDGD